MIPSITMRALMACIAAFYTAAASQVYADDRPDPRQFFEARIRPLLLAHCIDCHGPDAAEGGLRLDVKAGWQRGGERGPAIVPGDPSTSLLVRAVTYRDETLRMPPLEAGGKLDNRQLQDLIDWVRDGAHDPREGLRIESELDVAGHEHWAFQPIQPLAIGIAENPVDFLIDRGLDERGMTPAPPADMTTLIRRATYDLIGLPPTADQLTTAEDQFPGLVRELLASPRYGERWARHWLDVARYSDAKDGVLMYGDARIRPFAYTYRDYVIRAFNDDKPFDRFVREQLAADRMGLPADSPDLAAMGFLTLGRMFDRNRHDVIDDQIDVIGRGFLGLTLACARCHDHKFDPVPTADYYSLYGVFASGIEPYDRPRIAPVSAAGAEFEEEFAAKLREIREKQREHYEATLETARRRTPEYLVAVATTPPDVTETTIFFLSLTPEQLRPQITWRWRQLIARREFRGDPLFGAWHDLMRDPVLRPREWRERGIDERIIDALVAASPRTPADIARVHGEVIRGAWEEGAGADDPLVALVVSPAGPVWFPERDVEYYLSRQPGDAYRGLLGQLDAIAVKHNGAAPRAMVMHDAERLHDPVIFQRGDPTQRGNPVPRQFLELLSPAKRAPFTDGGGRLDLADAIASPDNPLTARVWVNRVWMHHFGEPLVDDPSDFGLRTPLPLQHQLLDYLASYFLENGWRTKPLHELIMSSRAYQRSSRIPNTPAGEQQASRDPTNSLLWRANRRRLDLEQMHDALLFVSGELSEEMYGRPRPITDEGNHRRAIYAFVERQNIPAVFQTFDFANADTSTARRAQTTVPQQALFAMNSPFVLARSQALSRRVDRSDRLKAVIELHRLVHRRDPTVEETAFCLEFLRGDSLERLAHVLLMSNEFMFVD